jgi:hypothetical protein
VSDRRTRSAATGDVHLAFEQWLSDCRQRAAPSLRPVVVVRSALSAARRDLARMAGITLIVTTLLTVADAVLDEVITPHRTAAYIASEAASLGLDLFLVSLLAGFFVRSVGSLGHGLPDDDLWDIVRTQPYGRLVVADFLSALLSVIGLFLFVLPGVAILTLTCLTGPVVKIERARPVGALVRSCSIVRHHVGRIMLLFVLPFLASGLLVSLLGPFEHHQVVLYYLGILVINVVANGYCGLILAELALRTVAIAQQRAVNPTVDPPAA